MKQFLLRCAGFAAGCLVTYVAVMISAASPARTVAVREVDGIAVRGGRIELQFDLRDARTCPVTVDRQMWRWQRADDGSQVQLIVPLPSISAPIVQNETKRIVLSIEVPPSLTPGEWFYSSRSTWACSWLGPLSATIQTRSPDVAVQIVEH